MIQGFENSPHSISPLLGSILLNVYYIGIKISNFEAHMRTYRAMNRAQAKNCIPPPRLNLVKT